MSKLKSFMDQYASESSQQVMTAGIKRFIGVIYDLTKEELKDLDISAKVNQYLQEKRNYKKDIVQFQQVINGAPVTTWKTYINAVKQFLMYNDIEFPQKFWKSLRKKKKGSRPVTMDKAPTQKELRQILSYMPIQGKALYSLLAASGMRIGECLQLEMNDLDFDLDPEIVFITIPANITKTGDARFAIGNTEARELLEAWFTIRKEFLKTSLGYASYYIKHGKKTKKQIIAKRKNQVFPFSQMVAAKYWNNALDQAKLAKRDRSSGRRLLHPHSLRKFFRTNLPNVGGVPKDVVGALLGHSNDLDKAYERLNEKQIIESYKSGMFALTIFGEAEDMKRLKDDLDKQKERLTKSLDTFNKVTKDNKDDIQKQQELTERLWEMLEAQQKTNEELRKEIAELHKALGGEVDYRVKLEDRLTQILEELEKYKGKG